MCNTAIVSSFHATIRRLKANDRCQYGFHADELSPARRFRDGNYSSLKSSWMEINIGNSCLMDFVRYNGLDACAASHKKKSQLRCARALVTPLFAGGHDDAGAMLMSAAFGARGYPVRDTYSV